MSDDIVERLRQQATIGAKKFGDAADIPLEWKAATEIERLRARVEVLERVRAATIERSVSGCRASVHELKCALRDSEQP
jgi:hypothetical protein